MINFAQDNSGNLIHVECTFKQKDIGVNGRFASRMTASGYGKQIPCGYTANGYRVYAVCYSNVASHYIIVRGQKFLVNECYAG